MAVLYYVWCGVDSGRVAPATRAIADWLNENGITTQQGNFWTRPTVAVALSQYGLISDIERYRLPSNLKWRQFLSQEKV